MSTLPLNALRAFEAAARHLSFAKAARELNVTPAALSHQIKGLEQTLNAKLFLRLTRAVALTEAGKLLYPGVHEGLTQIRMAVAKVDQVADDRVLVVSVGPAFTAKWLLPRLPAFLQAHPEIDARISANLGRSDFFSDGVDVAIRFGRMDVTDDFIARPLLPDAVLPVCSPAFLASRPLNEPADLAGVPLIHDTSLVEPFDGAHAQWADWLGAAGVSHIDATRGIRVNIADHAINAAAAGAGVGLVRHVLVQDDLKAGRLIAPF
ncbi:MAG: LysR substrate-binding domain-containing protein, partial [Pseudomonadota bacterium]